MKRTKPKNIHKQKNSSKMFLNVAFHKGQVYVGWEMRIWN